MSEYSYYPLELGSQPFVLDAYKQSPQQPQPSTPFDFDFSSFGIDQPQCAPQDPQEFDDELEALLAQDVPTNVPVTDHSAVFERVRTGTPTRGVPSTFTVSSESAYDSVYNENESVYTYNSASDLSALYEPFSTMNFQPLAVVDSDYSAASPISSHGSPNSSLGMNLNAYSPTSYSHRGSYSDYDSSPHIRVPPSSASDYYSQITVPVKFSSSMQATVSPANVSAQLPSFPTTVVASQREVKQDIGRTTSTKDPKRKYQCPNCPRGKYLVIGYILISTHDLASSFCSCVQPQDAYPDSRPQSSQAIRLSAQVVWSCVQSQA